MTSILCTGEQQPKDIPFRKSDASLKHIGVKYKNTKYLTAVVIFICFSAFYYGYCLSFTSAIPSKIYKEYFGQWAGESSTLGWLIGCFPIGGAIGSGIARILIKFLSRKKVLTICSLCAVAVAGIIQIPDIRLLLAFRVVQGIIVGNYMAVTPLFINEITPIDLKGTKGVFSQIMIVVGIVVAYFFKVIFTVTGANHQVQWRFIFGFSGFIPLIQFFLLIFNVIPQSPMSLVEQGRFNQAKQIIGLFNVRAVVNDVLAQMIHQSKAKERNKIAKQNGAYDNKQEMPNAVQNQYKIVTPRKPSPNQSQDRLDLPENIDAQLPPVRRLGSRKLSRKQSQILKKTMEIYKKQKNLQPAVQKILEDHHSQHEPIPVQSPSVTWKALLLGFQLHFMQQFSGIKMIITELSIVFNEYNPTIALYIPLISNIVQLIASFFSSMIVKQYGRKTITVFGNISLSIVQLIIAVLFVIFKKQQTNLSLIYGAVALIILFMIGYTTTIGPVVWLYVPEMIPHSYVPIASIFNWTASSICVIITPYILNAVGSPYPVFFFFGVVLFIFFLINVKFLQETKGLTPHEVADLFAGKTVKKEEKIEGVN